MLNKILTMILLFMVIFVRPAGAKNKQVIFTTGPTVVQLNAQKYEREDDFLYEEKIVDLIVDQKKGELVEKDKLQSEDF